MPGICASLTHGSNCVLVLLNRDITISYCFKDINQPGRKFVVVVKQADQRELMIFVETLKVAWLLYSSTLIPGQ